jgi:YD repeat-containing protein
MESKTLRSSKLWWLNRMGRAILASLLLLAAPVTAYANALSLLNLQVSQVLMFQIQAGSTCVSYTYDANGNRTAQVVGMIGSGSTQWGSGTYGCFLWLQ